MTRNIASSETANANEIESLNVCQDAPWWRLSFEFDCGDEYGYSVKLKVNNTQMTICDDGTYIPFTNVHPIAWDYKLENYHGDLYIRSEVSICQEGFEPWELVDLFVPEEKDDLEFLIQLAKQKWIWFQWVDVNGDFLFATCERHEKPQQTLYELLSSLGYLYVLVKI